MIFFLYIFVCAIEKYILLDLVNISMSQVVNCLVPNTWRHNHERWYLACTNNVQRKIEKKKKIKYLFAEGILAKCDFYCRFAVHTSMLKNIAEMGKKWQFSPKCLFSYISLGTNKKMKFLEERKNVTITSIFIIALTFTTKRKDEKW